MNFINKIKIKLRSRYMLRASGWLFLLYLISSAIYDSFFTSTVFVAVLFGGAMAICFLCRAVFLLNEAFRDEQYKDVLKAIEKIGDANEIGNEISKLQKSSYVRSADVRYSKNVFFAYIHREDFKVDIRIINPKNIQRIQAYNKSFLADGILISYKDHNNHRNSVEIQAYESYGQKFKDDIIKTCNLGEINKNKLVKKLKPYFNAGVLRDTLYISDEFCIFNYFDVAYVGFPCEGWNEYPMGMLIPTQYVEECADNHLIFREHFKVQLEDSFDKMCHFSEDNVELYIKNMEKRENRPTSEIDSELNERLKQKSQYKINDNAF